jgi:hypothetical protein
MRRIDLRGDGEEVAAVLPVDLALIEQLDVRLVDDGCGLQPTMPPFACELPRREQAELIVDERNQPVERLAAAVTPRVEDLSDFRG